MTETRRLKIVVIFFQLILSFVLSRKIIESYNEDAEAKSKDETKTVPTNFNGKYITCKTQDLCILFAFLLITIALLTAVSIYCYLIKHHAKQNHLLPFHVKNNELKQVLY